MFLRPKSSGRSIRNAHFPAALIVQRGIFQFKSSLQLVIGILRFEILLDDSYSALVFRWIRIPTVQCSPGVCFMTPAIGICGFHAIAGKAIKAVCHCVFMSFCYCELRIASISYAQACSTAKSLVPCCQHRIYRIARILCFFKYRLVLMRRQRCRKLLLNECSFAAAFTSTTNFHGVGFMLPPPPAGF